MRKKYLVALIALVLAVLGVGAVWGAQAAPKDKCYETVVVTDAWVETINHPAVTVTETWNLWSNPPGVDNDNSNPGKGNEQGREERWVKEGDKVPGGPAGTPGAWELIRTETRTVVVTEAWTETKNHPAVTEEKEVPCPEEPETPETPETPEKPDRPEEKPDKVAVPRPDQGDGDRPVARPVEVPTAVAAGK